jgi:hypothetical protein
VQEVSEGLWVRLAQLLTRTLGCELELGVSERRLVGIWCGQLALIPEASRTQDSQCWGAGTGDRRGGRVVRGP